MSNQIMRDADSTIIEPKTGWARLNIGELWRFKGLFYFLAWRDVKVKYRQTAIGILWAILQPTLGMLLFTAIFSRLARMPSDNAPYPVFVFLGLLPWNYFATVLGQSTTSLVGGANLITKIYFPRLIIPVSSAMAALLDLFIASSVLGVLMYFYGIRPGASIVLVLPLLILTLMNAIGFGLWLSALNVRYRDVQYAVPFLIQIWMFATPVVYPGTVIGGKWRLVLLLNPMTGVIEAMRASVLGHMAIPWGGLAVSALSGFLVFLSGLLYFKRVERYFADVI
ncbi:MAG: ABC transporter permease [Deltaproteobacteria bacterium]